MIHATTELDDDKDVRFLVLTGSTKTFAAGADISKMKDRNWCWRNAEVDASHWKVKSHVHVLDG
jgi:enoyl-CoA hydratase/carnithine racemase